MGVGMLRGKSFLVSWFLGFKVPKMYQMSISCFQEDIDFISKMFRNLLDGSARFVGARLFGNCQNVDFQNFEIYKNDSLKMCQGIVLVFVEVSWCLQR